MELENEQETGYTFDQLAAALDGTPQPDQSDSEIESSQAEPEAENPEAKDAPQETAEPFTAKTLAERLGMPVKDLYKSLQIDIGDGKTVTLSEYKDKAKEFHRIEQLQAKATDAKLKSEQDILQKSMALDEAMAQLGRPLNQADIDRAEQRRAAHTQAQTALLAQIVPEFADPAERDKGLQVISATFKDYAFSDAQIPWITDARLRKMAYDLGKLRAELASVADAEVKPKVKQEPKAHTPAAKPLKGQLKGGKLKLDAAVAQLAKHL